MEKSLIKPLEELALHCGVLTEHWDGFGRRQEVPPETLFSVLRSLEVPLGSPRDVLTALREKRFQFWDGFVEPVLVIWEGGALETTLRVSEEEAYGYLRLTFTFEGGGGRSLQFQWEDLPTLERKELDHQIYWAKQLKIPGPFPWGYHRLSLETPMKRKEVLLLSAPREAFSPPELTKRKQWGAFAPLYSLHSKEGWGAGDFSDLQRLSEWVKGLGGSSVGTLPFLASFLEESFNPSPYSPVSRLFWNEFYLDPMRVPELPSAPRAKEILGALKLQGNLQALRAAPQVDYRRLMALKRKVLQELAQVFFAEPSPRRDRFEKFLKAEPALLDYARFRAVHEKLKVPWTQWPHALREGRVQPNDYEKESEQYHLYVQWVCREQVTELADKARGDGLALYLDFPLGVHPDGWDVWREKEIFPSGVSAGAPPDAFFTQGQNWGFPPLHPEKIREQGHRYFIAVLRHHLQAAGILRLDHVMGFHRLYWIPHGRKATEGCYVRYPFDEFYAILCLESFRSQTLIVGEDLGTVPPEVRPAMKEHRIFRTYVGQFGFTGNPLSPLDPVPSQCVASLNTHDTPTFAGFWKGLDIEDREALGLIDSVQGEKELQQREELKKALIQFFKTKGWVEGEETILKILRGCLKQLAQSEASLILINLEDFWEETRPQNVPGTWKERPNWLRKMQYSLEEFSQMPEVVEALKEIHRLRRESEGT